MSASSKTKLNRKLNGYTPLQNTDKTKDFLRDFFKVLSPAGQENLADDVLGCANDEELRGLVQRIITELLIPLKAQGGKTPTDITASPQSGAKDSVDNHCLERDGNRCLATGSYSHTDAHPRNVRTSRLEAAHIIPFALGSFRANDREAVDRHATIWTNLRHYFPVLRTISFSSATGIAHQYKITTFPGAPSVSIEHLPRNRLVKFRVHKGNWELPDPALLKIYACIGHYLHMSGEAEIIDKVLRDLEDCGGLAPSGSTNIADLLAASRLSLLQGDPGTGRYFAGNQHLLLPT